MPEGVSKSIGAYHSEKTTVSIFRIKMLGQFAQFVNESHMKKNKLQYLLHYPLYIYLPVTRLS
jgi:hypothetical protein